MGTKTKSFVRSLRNNGLKLLLDVQDVCVTVSKDGLSTGTKKCHKTVKYQCSKALPAHMSDRWLHVTWPTQGFRDRKRATLHPSAGEQSLVHLYVNSQTTKIAIQPAWRCLWLRFRVRGTQSNKSRAGGPLYREAILRVYHTKEKQGKYSQLIIPTGILCCRAKQYSQWGMCVTPAVRWQMSGKIILSSVFFNLVTVLMACTTA